MSLFGTSTGSLFDLLGRGRTALTGARAATSTAEKEGASTASAPRPLLRTPITGRLEKAIDALLELDGDPVLVVDDELDLVEAAKDDRPDEAEGAFGFLSVSKDTAVVAGAVLAAVVAIAYLAGRTMSRDEAAPGPSVAAKPAPPATAPKVVAPPPPPPAGSEPAPAPKPPAETPRPVAKPGAFELQVVSGIGEDKAQKVVEFLNHSPQSPLAETAGLEAYVRGGTTVRIRGFEEKDEAVKTRVDAMRDPTGGGGRLGEAAWRKSP